MSKARGASARGFRSSDDGLSQDSLRVGDLGQKIGERVLPADPWRFDAGKTGIRQTIIAAWKRLAVEGISVTVSGDGEMAKAATETDLDI